MNGFSAHDVLAPAGVQASRIAGMGWLVFWICAVVFAIVTALVLGAAARRRETAGLATPWLPPREPRTTRVVTAATALTAIVLFGILIGDIAARRGMHPPTAEPALQVQVTGHQWWWEFEYQDPDPAKDLITASEIHLPLGRPIHFLLRSTDVIHSFWIPNLNGKKDLIPGHPADLWITADRAGSYIGECAKYCGMQHASMRFVVVAEPEAAFQQWLAAQRRPAAEPMTARARRGRDVFLGAACVMCHTVRGTPARGTVGPNLTHVASLHKIASGWLPNTPGHLAGWFADPQRLRPGVRMPRNVLAAPDLRALLDYLETLK